MDHFSLFDFFEALVAFKYASVFVAALSSLGIGAVLVGYALYRRMTSLRIPARIVGVRMIEKKKRKMTRNRILKRTDYANEMYRTVFEFVAPNGQSVEAVAAGSSNWIGGRVPGKKVDLWVNPRDFQDAMQPTSVSVLLLVGLLFVGAGFFLGNRAISTLESNTMGVVIGLSFILYCLVKFMRKNIRESGLLKSLLDGSAQKIFEKYRRSSVEKRYSEGHLLTREEWLQRLEIHHRNSRRQNPALIFIGVGFVIAAVYLGMNMMVLIAEGKVSIGEVVRIESVYRPSSEGSSYNSGKTRKATSITGSGEDSVSGMIA